MVGNMLKNRLPRLYGRRGVTYIMLAVTIVIIGVTTNVLAQSWKMASQMEKEEELLWRGNQIRQAIQGYYEYRMSTRGGVAGDYYPALLQDLVSDPGRVGYRWLRKEYNDPVTEGDWVFIHSGSGGIMGVRSSSEKEPLKKDNFDLVNKSFVGKTRYAEWVFQYPSP